MSKTCCGCCVGLLLMVGLVVYQLDTATNSQFASAGQHQVLADSFLGSKAGDEREVGGVRLCWCPAGWFRMGSPPEESRRHANEEAQVEVTLSKGFWMGKYEVTQGQWKRVTGEFPGKLTAIAGG